MRHRGAGAALVLLLAACGKPPAPSPVPVPAPPPVPAAVKEVPADPWKAACLAVEREIRDDPRFRRFLPIDSRAEPPWLVLAQRQKDPARHATVNVLGTHASVLRAVHEEFRRLLVEAQLPDPTTEALGNPALLAFVFTDRANFEAWHSDGIVTPKSLVGTRGYVSMLPRPLLLLYDTGAGSAIQGEDSGIAAFLGAGLLLREVRRGQVVLDEKKRDPGAEDIPLWDARVAVHPRWFAVGFCELLGAADRVSGASGEWRLLRPSVDRLREWGDPLVRGPEDQWSLEDLVAPMDADAVTELAKPKWPDRTPEMASLFSAQAWGLCHFLLSGKEGAYRTRFLHMLRQAVLTGGGPDLFDRSMQFGEGEARAKAIAAFTGDWHDYVRKLQRDRR